jgi:CO dehydrogenase maturation factor
VPYIIAVAGKGGVGKTTISALLVRYLLGKHKPVLAVDADPNSNLSLLLGLDAKETISDIREETKNLASPSLPKTDFLNFRLQEIVTEGDGVDLLTMGVPEGPGCYCAVNNILRDYLSKLIKNYKFVVIDNEAGMEHLSRRTADNIDRLLLVSDTTMVGIQSAIRALRVAEKAGLKVKRKSLLINRMKSPLEEEKLKIIEAAGLTVDCCVPFYGEIEKSSESGEQLTRIDDAELEKIFTKLSF